MKTTTKAASAWPSLDKLPPGIVSQILEFIGDGSKPPKPRLDVLTRMVELVEMVVRFDLQEFITPPPGKHGSTSDDVRRMLFGLSAFVSVVEDGVLEYDLRVNGTPELVVRYLQSFSDALAKVKSLRAVLVAALDNALGAMRNETVEQRLRRSINAARVEAPIYLGSFAQYADPDASADK